MSYYVCSIVMFLLGGLVGGLFMSLVIIYRESQRFKDMDFYLTKLGKLEKHKREEAK